MEGPVPFETSSNTNQWTVLAGLIRQANWFVLTLLLKKLIYIFGDLWSAHGESTLNPVTSFFCVWICFEGVGRN